MRCQKCSGEVIWRGPLSDLTHTQCRSCGGINCQRATPEFCFDDSDMNQVHAGAAPVAQQGADALDVPPTEPA
jgi:hypothetical protein